MFYNYFSTIIFCLNIYFLAISKFYNTIITFTMTDNSSELSGLLELKTGVPNRNPEVLTSQEKPANLKSLFH